ncbi:MAG: anaerobic ribonucleoside-triphosphate reductase activating protein [Candidatus Omnitrophota bacterium]
MKQSQDGMGKSQTQTSSKLISKQPCKRFNIKGFQEVSLLEWEGKLTSILFLPGCNLRCGFCHAKALVLDRIKETVPFEKITAYLKTKRLWLDAVVISGGEPTMHEWLTLLIDEIKKYKLKVMLETNGTHPDKIKALLDAKKLDYIAMDIKAPLAKYKTATATDINTQDIAKSIQIIMSSGIDYEFRTTVVPGIINVKDIKEIARLIKGARKLSLQQFSPKDTLDSAFLKIKPYPKNVLEEMGKIAREFVDEVAIKNA